MGKATITVAVMLALTAVYAGPGMGEKYEPETIFHGADEDPAVGIGGFIPGDGYGLGPLVGSLPLVGYRRMRRPPALGGEGGDGSDGDAIPAPEGGADAGRG